jgi:hypothetical protein
MIALCAYIFGNSIITKITITDVGKLVSYMGIIYFLYLVIIALVVFTSMFFKSSAASITTIVVITSSIFLLYMAINNFLGIDLTIYSPIMNIVSLMPNNADAWMRAFVSGLGFMTVFIGGAIGLLEKRDIA